MPLLATFLGGLFASLVEFLTKYVTKRLAIFIALIAALVALLTATIASLNALIAGISLALPAFINDAMSWLVPSNLDDCIAIAVSAKVIVWVASWQAKVLEYKVGL